MGGGGGGAGDKIRVGEGSLLARSILVFDSKPAMTFIIPHESFGCDCVCKSEESCLLSPLFPQSQIDLQSPSIFSCEWGTDPLFALAHKVSQGFFQKIAWCATRSKAFSHDYVCGSTVWKVTSVYCGAALKRKTLLLLRIAA